MRPSYKLIALLLVCAGVVCGQQWFEPDAGGSGLYAPLQAAQPVSASAVRRTLAGTVMNSVTGEPIRRALVRVNGPEMHSAFTGADGRFEIPNLPEGQITVSAQKPGFFEDQSRSAPLPSPAGAVSGSFYTPSGLYPFNVRSTHTITLGPTTGDLVLKLAPEARIKGRIVDENGEPIEGMRLQLMAQAVIEGRNQWQLRGGAATDDNGAYSLDGLQPGTYAIRNFPMEVEAPTADKKGTQQLVFPGTYYPNAPDLSSVQPLELSAGQETSIDFTLTPVASYRVSGVVAGIPEGVNLLCEDAEGQPVATRSFVDPRSGKFTISGLTPGSWVLHAVVPGKQMSDSAEAYLPIEVSGSDVGGIVLRPQRLPSIPVVQSGSEGQQAVVQLVPTSGTQERQYQANHEPSDPAENIAFHAIAPGKYRVSVQVNGGTSCVGSILSGGMDLMRDPLTVAAGSQPAPIEVTLTTECASLSGSVVSSAEQPTGGYLILAGDSGAGPTALPLGNDGKFSLRYLTPGSYRIFAFSDISGLEYANPEAMRDFSGMDVSVGPKERSVVRLDLITRSH